MMKGSILILLHLKSKNGIKLGWIMTLPPYPEQETILGVHTKTFTSQSEKWLGNERLKNIYKHCLLQVHIKERKTNVNWTCNYRTLFRVYCVCLIVSNLKLRRSKQSYVQSRYLQLVRWEVFVVHGWVKTVQDMDQLSSFMKFKSNNVLRKVIIIWVSKGDKEDDVVYKASRSPPTLRAKRVRLYCRPFI